jgi:hypothetical protein
MQKITKTRGGISYDKSSKLYKLRIHLEGRRYHLSAHKTEAAALMRLNDLNYDLENNQFSLEKYIKAKKPIGKPIEIKARKAPASPKAQALEKLAALDHKIAQLTAAPLTTLKDKRRLITLKQKRELLGQILMTI